MSNHTAAPFVVVPYHPAHLAEFVKGDRTLAELIKMPRAKLKALAAKGYQLLAADQVDRAVEFFRGLVALDPYSAWNHTALGVALLRSDAKADAEKHLRRALVINPRAVDTRVTLAELLLGSKGREAEGVAELEHVVRENIGSNDSLVVRARMLLNTRK
ncbi:MAG: hypothetical protein SFW67_37680 [Myxococcaceae bacterium]|nr:hypothetical protein [Myxococcaceae bacterium]